MKLLVVSGACRNVGKTYVAMRLCEILGNAIYAKIGHGVKASSKPENFFSNVDDFLNFLGGLSEQHYQYCIVESNNHMVCRLADVRIFIDAPPGTTDIRDDATELRRRADIVITPPGGNSADARPRSNIRSNKIPPHVSEDIPIEKLTILEKLFRDQGQYLSLGNM